MTGTMEWKGRTGDSWAAQWRRTDRSFGGLTDKLLSRTHQFPFDAALDIGCGAGELSLALGRRYPDARVVGVDISPQLVAVARERGVNHPNVSFELGDASQWSPPGSFAPQLLISRHGVMFFDDPGAAFAHLASLGAPGARLLFSCFRGPAENEIFTGIAGLLPPPETPPDPEAPGPMAFADPDRVRAVLTQGGWTEIELEPFDFAMVAGTGEDPVSDAMDYFLSIGPAAAALADMEPDERKAVQERMRAYLQSKQIEGIVAFGAAAWIVTARRG